MSLIVLNSKGSDPEDFQNYMTENIEFPANAEVCLVGSHINRKLMIEKEVQFSVHGNSLHFQYGHGGAAGAGRTYTPHAPYRYQFHNKAGIFPMKFKGYTAIEGAANAYLNDPNFTPISPLVGGWACDIPANDLFTLHNTQRVPDRAQSEGNTALADITVVPGHTNKNSGGINTTQTPTGADSVIAATVFPNWISVNSTSNIVSNFIDLKPLYNTDNGERVGTFTPLPSITNILGGGWHWQFENVGVATQESMEGMRGGIIASGGEIINPNKGDPMVYGNARLNKLTNNTDFCCWWQVDRVDTVAGSAEVSFYKRPIQTAKTTYLKQMDGAVKWGSIRFPASTQSIRIGIRPVNTGGTGYCLEGYGANVTTATNALIGGAAAFIPATNGGVAGICIVTDPDDQAVAPRDKFNLYRHLPIFQGATLGEPNGNINMLLNATHHGLHDGIMGAGAQAAGLPYTFGFQPLTLQDQAVEKFDSINYTSIQKSNVGYALGYSSSYLRQTATLMLPAADGVKGEIPINSTVPLAHSLVVSLPDLPISGFFGNSTGTAEAGTLEVNSGGTSAAIIGVIPFGEAPLRESNTVGFQNGDAGMAMARRGSWYSSPIENWIKLKNPHAFKVSSIRVRLTDELGTKPSICAGNTTITIKIKAPARGDVDRGLTIQGN